jgi:hypothetical protein
MYRVELVGIQRRAPLASPRETVGNDTGNGYGRRGLNIRTGWGVKINEKKEIFQFIETPFSGLLYEL